MEVEPEPPKDFEVEDSTVPPSGDQEIDLEAGPSESGSDAEFDPSSLIHESLQKGAKSKKKDKSESHTKYVPPDETPEQRNARTIFVGNVPVDVLKSRVCSSLYLSECY